MKRATLSVLSEWLLRLGLGGLFIYAGAMKVLDTQQFALDVQHYEITTLLDAWRPGMSWTLSILIATYLPWLEIFAGGALLARRLYAGALAVIAALSVVFLVAIGSAWWRGLDITCGCFGREENATNFTSHITLNVVMLAAAASLAGMEWHRARLARRAAVA